MASGRVPTITLTGMGDRDIAINHKTAEHMKTFPILMAPGSLVSTQQKTRFLTGWVGKHQQSNLSAL
jgi:hypothetical protein